MIQLPYLSVARVSGPDASEFLHAQLSADIQSLEPGSSGFATYCSPRGQVYGLLLVGLLNDSYTVVSATELMPFIIQRLRVFVLRSKVEIEQETGQQVFGVSAPSGAPEGFAVLSPAARLLNYAIGSRGESSDEKSNDGNINHWKSRELQCGVTWLDSRTSENFIPQMLGFDQIGAVSFSKGCYPGQEIIARSRYLGKVKRKPVIVRVEGDVSCTTGQSVKVSYGAEYEEGKLVDCVVESGQNTCLFIVSRDVEGQNPGSVIIDGTSFSVI